MFNFRSLQPGQITYVYARQENRKPFACIAIYHDDGGGYGIGVSRCNPKDEFNKVRARAIASDRAEMMCMGTQRGFFHQRDVESIEAFFRSNRDELQNMNNRKFLSFLQKLPVLC